MALVICESCANKYSDYGRDKCPECGHSVTTTEELQRQQKAIEASIEAFLLTCKDIAKELEQAKGAGCDYVGINPDLRERAETAYSFLMAKPLSTWSEGQIEFYRVLNNFEGRENFHRNLQLSRIENSLTTMIDIMKIQSSTLSSISPHLTSLNSNISGVKAGTTMSGMMAAHNLGEHMADQMFED